ncbi:sporulation and cell division protein SsgA [Streptomyces sp. 1114.5]|uniref:SsgA family sporulation/cell division regulator n=1 Tax=unclassified Streptomyces TaxID=2593676 RepID=UPI000BD484BA|nr:MULTISPECIES: SsgA family sporulation/cell division regulator [unclassified Streptomyces]RKT09466.1 sporulation and cell division protein SsgA [Streptomyces sp. 1114.5]SOB88530.1 Streptomyces sporulation and cell division protein, SsgA [Streptomyces sp. 1331.2]
MQKSAVRPMPVTFPDSAAPDVPIDAELRFDAALPHAACLAFPFALNGCPGGGELCWYFSRDLLNEGRHAPAGCGDVKVRPGPAGEVLITLRSPDGQSVLSAPEDVVTAFLVDSFTLVPAGSEADHLDVDAALARLCADD